MGNDPRKGKQAIINKRKGRGQEVGSTTLDIGFDLFYSAKRTEGVRKRTLADYKSYWRYFREWLTRAHPEIELIGQITVVTLREYTEYMSHEHKRYEGVECRKKDGKNLSPATVASRLRALQTMCKFWGTEGLTQTNAAEKIKAPRKDVAEKNIISDEQLSAIIAAADTTTFAGYRDRVLMLLLADSGLRINEALQLEDTFIDIRARCIRLPGLLNKNRKPRIVPVSASVLREVIRLMEETRDYFNTQYVFVSNYGERLKADQFRKRLRQYAIEASIDTSKTQVSPHRFRDYFITNYLLNGGDLFTLQRIVAHADIKTTQGYVKVNEEAMRDSHTQYSQISRLGVPRARKRGS
ncbi:tyrosine-type recombinase/integrase [Paenibacillus lautus]|uniref:tyrosine-type recombinase/integrase n=1 Tax=Paenibacillus lautus TaxID=1401 RepID=UPI002DBF44A8|nr:tyrosine-type recombinase/integrase [Paenibacillus lautus]MEC0253642.1 tyrosine-type recombinase/integrase [Paenibacillus lautus]